MLQKILFTRVLRLACMTAGLALVGLPIVAEGKAEVRCGGVYDTCRFIVAETGAAISEVEFDLIRPFHEERAVIRQGGRYGFIDTSGSIVVAPQYDLAGPFYQGLAEVFLDGKAGVIDRAGRTVVAPHFYRAIPFTSEVLLVSEWPQDADVPGLGRLLGRSDNGVEDTRDAGGLRSSIGLNQQGRFRLWHIRGGWVDDPGFLHRLLGKAPLGHRLNVIETEGLGVIAAQEQGADRDAPWGLLTATGNWLIEPGPAGNGKGRIRGQFSEGLMALKMDDLALTGVIDTKGHEVIAPRYLKISPFHAGHAIAQHANGMGRMELRRASRAAKTRGDDPDKLIETVVIDQHGAPIGEHKLQRAYSMTHPDYDGPAVARVQVNGVWFGLTAKGELISDPIIGLTTMVCPSGITGRFVTDKTISLFDANDRPLSEMEFKEISPIQAVLSGLRKRNNPRTICQEIFQEAQTGGFFALTPKGHLVQMPMDFEEYRILDDLSIAGKRDGKWGLFSQDGHEILAPQFGKLQLQARGFYIATFPDPDHRVLFYDADGMLITNAKRKFVQTYLTHCPQGGQMIQRDGKWGLVDEVGEALIAPQYEAITCFKQGLAWAPYRKTQSWCPITPDGVWHMDRCRAELVPAPPRLALNPRYLDPYDFDAVVNNMRVTAEFGIGLRDALPK